MGDILIKIGSREAIRTEKKKQKAEIEETGNLFKQLVEKVQHLCSDFENIPNLDTSPIGRSVKKKAEKIFHEIIKNYTEIFNNLDRAHAFVEDLLKKDSDNKYKVVKIIPKGSDTK